MRWRWRWRWQWRSAITIATTALFVSAHLPAIAWAQKTTNTTTTTAFVRQCVQANERGQDLRTAKKFRDAEVLFESCATPGCPQVVRADCLERLTEAREAAPTVAFSVLDEHDAHLLTNVKVSMDGGVIASSLEVAATTTATTTAGSAETSIPLAAIRVDPGDHLFELVSAGYIVESRRVHINESDRRKMIVVRLRREKQDAPSSSPSSSSSGIFGMTARTQQGLAVGIGAAGMTSVVVAAVLGLHAKLTYDDAYTPRNCPRGPSSCTTTAVADIQTAEQEATIATVMFVSGIVLIAGGIALHLLRPSSSSTTSQRRGGGSSHAQAGSLWSATW